MTGFQMDRALAERRHATRRLFRSHAVREWPVRQARLPVPDARQSVDRWTTDLALALGAIAFLLLIATVAILINPVRP